MKCIQDEIPFEVPEGWEWSRLGSAFFTITGSTPYTKDTSLYGTDYPFYKPSDLNAGFYVYTSEDTVSEKGYQTGRILPKYSVLVTCIGATIGKTGYIRNSGICNQQINAILPCEFLIPEYTYFCMCSEFEQVQILKKSSSTTLPILNKSKFDNLLFPVPPQSEQLMIVKKANKLFQFTNIIQTEKDSLQEVIIATKSKILDLAIRGKLIPQDPNDEPASVLLERIRKEKEELIKQGKIKKNKKESVIFKGEDNSYYEKVGNEATYIDEKLPYVIPDTWTWMRLENCCAKEIRRGKSPKYAEKSNVLVFAQKCNTKYNGIDINLGQYLDETILKRYPADEYMQNGDVVINSTGMGTLGRVGFYRNIDNTSGLSVVPDSHVTIIRGFSCIQSSYLYAFMKAHQKELEKKGEGSTNQKELKPLTLKEMLVPIPPLSEQKRISEAIENAIKYLATIEKSLN